MANSEKKEKLRKKLLLNIFKDGEIEGLALEAIEMTKIMSWSLIDACGEVAADVVGGVGWFLPNFEDYGFMYTVRLSEIIEEEARKTMDKPS